MDIQELNVPKLQHCKDTLDGIISSYTDNINNYLLSDLKIVQHQLDDVLNMSEATESPNIILTSVPDYIRDKTVIDLVSYCLSKVTDDPNNKSRITFKAFVPSKTNPNDYDDISFEIRG